jgi:hypothetical protein
MMVTGHMLRHILNEFSPELYDHSSVARVYQRKKRANNKIRPHRATNNFNFHKTRRVCEFIEFKSLSGGVKNETFSKWQKGDVWS